MTVHLVNPLLLAVRVLYICMTCITSSLVCSAHMKGIPNITSTCNHVKADIVTSLFPFPPGGSCVRRILLALIKQREQASISSAAENLPQFMVTDTGIAKNTDEQIEDTWEKWAAKGKQVGRLHHTPAQDHRACFCCRRRVKRENESTERP